MAFSSMSAGRHRNWNPISLRMSCRVALLEARIRGGSPACIGGGGAGKTEEKPAADGGGWVKEERAKEMNQVVRRIARAMANK